MQNSSSTVLTPTLKRRLICLVYEAFLMTAVAALGIFVVAFIASLLKLTVLNAGNTLTLFVVLGIYFIHAWTGSGFTLAMKTWRIKIVKVGHASVPYKAAALRYVLAWGWVLPALVVSYLAHLTRGQTGIALALGIVAWALTALLDKDRQFLHDKLAGTRLISLPKAVKRSPADSAAPVPH